MIVKGRVSIVIPSRCERFLQPTIDDVLAKAYGDVEVVVNLDGYWPDPPLKDDPRLVVVHQPSARGMRAGINAGVRASSGQFIFKLDGHCMVEPGFDVVLKEACDDDWVVVPRRQSLDPIAWAKKDTGKSPVDAHYLSWPYERPGDKTNGLHGNVWNARARERLNVWVDDEMSSQGSAYFTSRAHWDRTLGDLGTGVFEPVGTFAQEFQEVGCKTWLSGGQVKVNKRTSYYHLHKGKTYGTGYQFNHARWNSWAIEKERARRFTIDFWLRDHWRAQTRTFAWLMERFWPVPGWPDDWQKIVAETPLFTYDDLMVTA